MSMIGQFRLADDADLQRLRADPNEVVPFVYEQSVAAEEEAYLDKAWHGIHYLLTGTPDQGEWPLNFVLGGEPLGEDMGYGPARVFTSDEVKQISAALQPFDDDELTRRYDPTEMASLNIYPHPIWSREEERKENLTYLLVNFRDLKAVVDRGAREGRAMIGWLS